MQLNRIARDMHRDGGVLRFGTFDAYIAAIAAEAQVGVAAVPLLTRQIATVFWNGEVARAAAAPAAGAAGGAAAPALTAKEEETIRANAAAKSDALTHPPHSAAALSQPDSVIEAQRAASRKKAGDIAVALELARRARG